MIFGCLIGRYKKSSLGLILLLILFSSTQVFGDVCAQIDDDTVVLTSAERSIAMALLRAAFDNMGVAVTETNCREKYTLRITRIGQNLQVQLYRVILL